MREPCCRLKLACDAFLPEVFQDRGRGRSVARRLRVRGARGGQLRVGDPLSRPLGDDDHYWRGRPRTVVDRSPVDQRRVDGDLLPPGRPGNQAGVARRRALVPTPGGPPYGLRARWYGGAGVDLSPGEQLGTRVSGMGDRDGHRYRLRARGAGDGRPAGAERPQDLSRCTGHRGRHRSRADHRALLHRRRLRGTLWRWLGSVCWRLSP